MERATARSTRLDVPRCARAFTLIELVLAMAVLALLLGLAVVGLDGLRTKASLNEGASRFETVLRMARSDAAGRGRRMSVAFDEATGDAVLLIEADPLGAPGAFAPYRSCTWTQQLPHDLVRVERCELHAGARQLSSVVGDEESVRQAIMFYPDGSADSARIELASRRANDARRAIVELDGMSGRIRTHWLDAR